MSNDDQPLNPAVPTTVGALLTEEAAMNPYTPLPSFYEMMLIEEAQRSTRKAIQDGLQALARQSSQQRAQSASFLGKMRDRIRHVAEFLARKYGPEVQLLITYMIERRFLMSSSSTMAESIYGGRRARVVEGNRLVEPTRQDRTRLALLLSLSWYLDQKLENLFRNWENQTPTRTWRWRQQQQQQQMKDFFVKLYPYLRMTKNGSIFAYQFLYLIGRTVYFHPESHMLGLVVRRMTQADVVIQNSDSSLKSDQQLRQQQLVQNWVPAIRKAAFWAVSSTLVLGWLFRLQQYIHQREQEQGGSRRMPPPPEAPALKLDPVQRIRIPESGQACPLCQQPWIAPSASPAGFVFCHKCLVLHVREHGTCPLTGARCSESDIVRIYEPQASAA